MFKKVFIENNLKDSRAVKNILEKIKFKEIVYLNQYDDVFEKVKKPYLQKRDNLNLFLANKRGELVKEAPDAYGLGGEKHFYFIHSLNCIYECEYCYLQGYFNSPDLVWFLNHDEIIKSINFFAKENPGSWFHAGEFSDSLALSHFTNEIPLYHTYFKNNPEVKLELRTKSSNLKALEKLAPLENFFITFSLSPEKTAKLIDKKASPLKNRLNTIEKLYHQGHRIGIHLDPIILLEDWKDSYEELIRQLSEHIPLKDISFISIGVVRFTKDVLHSFTLNYPESSIKTSSFIKSFDNKFRYPRPIRNNALRFVRQLLNHYGANDSKIYECME